MTSAHDRETYHLGSTHAPRSRTPHPLFLVRQTHTTSRGTPTTDRPVMYLPPRPAVMGSMHRRARRRHCRHLRVVRWPRQTLTRLSWPAAQGRWRSAGVLAAERPGQEAAARLRRVREVRPAGSASERARDRRASFCSNVVADGWCKQHRRRKESKHEYSSVFSGPLLPPFPPPLSPLSRTRAL